MVKSNLYPKLKNLVLAHRLALFFVLIVGILVGLIWYWANLPNNNVIKTQENMITLAENIRRFYKKKPDYWGLTTQNVLQNGIAPQNIVKDGNIFSPIAKEMLIGADVDGNMIMPGTRSFNIIYKGVSKKDCVDMATYPMSEKNKLGLLSVTIKNENEETVFQWGGEHPLPIDKTDAVKICRHKNIILWNFE